jgi:hypothetical protein
MTKRQNTIPGLDEGARLTPQEAVALVRPWANSYFCDDENAADFLLLLRSICYERELLDRENIVTEIERAVLPLMPSADKALNAVMSERLAVAHSLIKEGGTQ